MRRPMERGEDNGDAEKSIELTQSVQTFLAKLNRLAPSRVVPLETSTFFFPRLDFFFLSHFVITYSWRSVA